MINEVVINGYRGLDGFSMDGMTKFNLLVGPNNSGKSSFLEALFMHFAPLNFMILLSLLSFREGGFQTNPHYIVEQLKWLFTHPNDRRKLEISISGNWGKVKRETTISLYEYLNYGDTTTQIARLPDKVIPISNKIDAPDSVGSEGITIGTFNLGFQSGRRKKVEHKVEITTGKTLTIEPAPIQTDVNAVYSDPFLHRKPEAGIQEYDKSIKAGYHTKCLQLLQKVDPDIKNVSMLLAAGRTPKLFVDNKRVGLTPISALGDGIRRIYLLATQFVQSKGGVLLIDELEDSIHWVALSQFINWIMDVANELNVQIFATTHSLECIDAILASKLSKSKDLSLFRMRRHNGQIICKKIRGDTLETIRHELGQDVRW